MARPIDTHAIRLIHQYGKLSRDFELPTTSSEYRKTLELALQNIESELMIDYYLKLPDGISIRD